MIMFLIARPHVEPEGITEHSQMVSARQFSAATAARRAGGNGALKGSFFDRVSPVFSLRKSSTHRSSSTLGCTRTGFRHARFLYEADA